LKWNFLTSLIVVLNEAESVQFDLKTIEAATGNFSEHNKLGAGGFGEVYKVYIYSLCLPPHLLLL
jgi:hypothetical protein